MLKMNAMLTRDVQYKDLRGKLITVKAGERVTVSRIVEQDSVDLEGNVEEGTDVGLVATADDDVTFEIEAGEFRAALDS